MATIDDIFDAFKAALPTVKGKFPSKIVKLDVDGTCFIVNGKEGTVMKDDGSSVKKPDLALKTSLSTMQALLQKKMTAQQAFMKGKLKLKGNMGIAMKLNVLVNAAIKVMASSSATTSRL
uniref:SCP2 domain-containing protein n=1 Tax=Grammatophora oceanica TaxID=210454 RepID=A0A7S1UYL2_9STRA|mmetsp:Transcript_27427/g.40246  ORF Transcript_27427/g.40246 Transcript_27427/m.40246 type:complete len:120 (+) Transcript_27427:152-511(+)|eukprot:CAMPEP_0194047688 /NCGR_PEP_ID=MMETSP0009_2-20130614/25134_1 /TAXON_ID=210454 /ORGANISM="Grammatophora oceanica, Strain CCMP 410" /LENGTH=119 /DNA_ID=CAMNT_0038693371 /DNA_START=150 /DNA_END=509 /DNA_ORIENTATION=+